jgi:hypothetical protein
MSYYGSWKIDDNLTFAVNTHLASSGAATDADAVPAYRVYEDETTVPILTGDMALLDSANTVGFYSEQIALTAANGFEKGKSYTIYISAAVSSVTGTISHNFQIEAEVDANIVSDEVTVDAYNAALDFNATQKASINTEADTALTDYDPPTNAEMVARTLLTADYFDPALDTVANVTTVATTTTNSDMRGTDSAALAADYTAARAGYLDNLNIGENVAGTSEITALNNLSITDVITSLKNAGLVLHRAAIETVTSQTQFVIPATDDAPDNDAYNNQTAVIIDQTDPNQISVRKVTDYDAATRTVTIDSAATFTVVASDILAIIPVSVDLTTILGDTNDIQTRLPAGLVGGRMDSDVGNIQSGIVDADAIAANAIGASELATDAVNEIRDAILSDSTPFAGANIDAAVSTRATPAQVNTEVVDALATDTYAEPTGVPGATVTLATKLGYLYMALRNQITITSTKKTFFDDGAAAEWEKDLSDDGTTYTETEANAI